MRVIMGQHSNARQFNLSPIAIIKKNLNHIVFIKDDILEIFDGSREKAVISPAPINANPGSHRQLIFCLWFHFIYLKQIKLSNKNEGERIFSKKKVISTPSRLLGTPEYRGHGSMVATVAWVPRVPGHPQKFSNGYLVPVLRRY